MPHTQTLTRRILDALVDRGLLTAEQSLSVEDAARSRGAAVGAVLLERGLVSVADVEQVLEEELGVPHVNLANYAPEERALALVPSRLARERALLPLFEIEGMLTVAIGDAMDAFALDEVAAQVGFEVEPVLTEPGALASALREHYGSAGVAADEVLREAHAEAASAEGLEERSAGLPAEQTGFAVFDRLPSTPRSEEQVAFSETEEWTAPAEALGPEAHAGTARDGEPSLAVGLSAPASESEPAPEPEVAPEPEERAADEGPLALPPGEAAAEEAEAERETAEAGATPAVAASHTSAIDLDVLAVADARTVAVLVSEILEDAVARGATRVHLLPYKDDFFLVYRVDGALEQVAAAPLSFASALVEGFKHYARLTEVEPGQPALGRVRRRIADKELVLTVSVVPTVAGQRLVASLEPVRPAPRDLATLGASEAEARALSAMVERGRGILLVCAPVAGGSSTTYYALLAHAAACGRTAYSVERAVEYEIPAVAQVMVQPGGPSAAAYIAAGMRQDTEVIGVDGLRSVEDVHLAVEAAGHGKLVIATFPAAGIAAGVRRMLDLGAEPHSLAAALTLGVGQRLVRLNCPNCKQETGSDLARRIPGAPEDIVDVAGTGCPNCGKTGFRDVSGLFEVLPFTEPVRAAVARSADEREIHDTAIAAGMRPLVVAGLARVRSGEVSAEELNRVLRFAE